eukprot:364597-Chlamydomonas_euryale.AAC.20
MFQQDDAFFDDMPKAAAKLSNARLTQDDAGALVISGRKRPANASLPEPPALRRRRSDNAAAGAGVGPDMFHDFDDSFASSGSGDEDDDGGFDVVAAAVHDAVGRGTLAVSGYFRLLPGIRVDVASDDDGITLRTLMSFLAGQPKGQLQQSCPTNRGAARPTEASCTKAARPIGNPSAGNTLLLKAEFLDTGVADLCQHSFHFAQ